MSDLEVTENIEDRIARFQKGAYTFMSEMPPEMREELVEEMRARAASHPEWTRQRRRQVYKLGLWRSATLLKDGRP